MDMTHMQIDPKLKSLLDELHARSDAQTSEIENYFSKTRTGPWRGMEPRDHEHYADKLVALDRDKAEFCYALCRASGARRIVELGTSFGVSTIYLAAAVRDNGGGVVIGAEHEPQKLRAARANIEAAGLSAFVDLHEGDVLDAIKTIDQPIDFVLFDIWIQVVRPALDLLLPHLRSGTVICADNTAPGRNRDAYAPFFEIIDDPAHRFHTITLPFKGGFEMAVKG
jgi:predicted O-methyltransferase YrrM